MCDVAVDFEFAQLIEARRVSQSMFDHPARWLGQITDRHRFQPQRDHFRKSRRRCKSGVKDGRHSDALAPDGGKVTTYLCVAACIEVPGATSAKRSAKALFWPGLLDSCCAFRPSIARRLPRADSC